LQGSSTSSGVNGCNTHTHSDIDTHSHSNTDTDGN